MASFEDRVRAEWGNVQNTSGAGYVSDVSPIMDLTTLKNNLAKLNYWILHYQTPPVPSNLQDLYNKEVAGTGQSITAVVEQILDFLQTKKALYQQAIAAKEPSAPIYTEEPTLPEPAPPPPPVIDPGDSGDGDGGSNNTLLWIGGGLALLYLIRRKRKGRKVTGRRQNNVLPIVLGAGALLVLMRKDTAVTPPVTVAPGEQTTQAIESSSYQR